MAQVASRELRNRTRSVLERVEQGETVVITVDGRPVAQLEPIARRSRWIGRDRFIDSLLAHQADAGLTGQLVELSGETTDDLPFE
jgi:prevent-host-death family protein